MTTVTVTHLDRDHPYLNIALHVIFTLNLLTMMTVTAMVKVRRDTLCHSVLRCVMVCHDVSRCTTVYHGVVTDNIERFAVL